MTTTTEATDAIGRQAGRGLRWSLVGTILGKCGSFVMSLVLARLLTPSDFGMIAVALAAMNVLMHVNDVGIIAATVQWRGKLEEVAPTATTLAAAFGTAAYGVFVLAAPAFAALAGNRAAAPVVQLLTLGILIDGLTAVRSAALMRTFQQSKLIRANLAGLPVNAAVTIGLALSGAGAISYAYGQVAAAVVTGALVVLAARVPLRVGFDPHIARQLLRYGVPLAASLGIEAVIMNVQFVVVGKIAGAAALGFFLLAFNMSSWAQTILGTAIRYVSVAGFSRLSEHDEQVFSSGVNRSMSLLVTVVAPIVSLTAVLATPLVSLLYGGQWEPAAPVLRFLVVLTLVRMVTSLAMDALMGAGVTRSTLWIYLSWAAALLPTLWVMTHLGGIQGAAMAHAGVGVVVAVPLAAYALHRAGVRLSPLPRALGRPLLAAVLAGFVAYLAGRLGGPLAIVQLVVGGGAGALAYALTAVPQAQLREWLVALRRRPANVLK